MFSGVLLAAGSLRCFARSFALPAIPGLLLSFVVKMSSVSSVSFSSGWSSAMSYLHGWWVCIATSNILVSSGQDSIFSLCCVFLVFVHYCTGVSNFA